MTGLRKLLLLGFCAVGMSACAKAPSFSVYNATSDELLVRASVDSWFAVSNCTTGDTMGSMNQQDAFDVPVGQHVCLKAKPRKDDLPAAELVSRLIVIRDGNRCMTLTRDQLRDSLQRTSGILSLRVTETNCPAVGAAATEEAAATAP